MKRFYSTFPFRWRFIRLRALDAWEAILGSRWGIIAEGLGTILLAALVILFVGIVLLYAPGNAYDVSPIYRGGK